MIRRPVRRIFGKLKRVFPAIFCATALLLSLTTPATAMPPQALADAVKSASVEVDGCDIYVTQLATFFPENVGWTTAIAYQWSECQEGNAFGSFVRFYDFEGSLLQTTVPLAGASIENFANTGDRLKFNIVLWGPDDPHCCPEHIQRVEVSRDAGGITLSLSSLRRSP